MTTAWPAQVDIEVDDFAHRVGTVFASILDHDSACHSYGVSVGDEPWFVKGSVAPSAVPRLRNATALHAHVTHPSIAAAHRGRPAALGGRDADRSRSRVPVGRR